MTKNTAGQSIGAQLISVLDGSNFSGTVTVYVTGDAGTQAIGSVGSGLCTAEGNGYYTYRPAQAETNYDLIAFTFTGTNAITATIQVATILAAEQAAMQGATTATSISVRTLIQNTLKDLGVLSAGETMSAEDAADGLVGLNELIDSLATERLISFTVTRTTWTIVANTASYTLGTGGAIDIPRPTSIERINFQDTSVSPTLEYRLPLPLTEAAYQAIPQKTLTGTFPVVVYYNPTYTSGLGTVTFWYVPTSTTLQGVLYAPSPVQMVGLSDTLSLPPGYRRMYRSNLAMELADMFTRPISPNMIKRAMESKANVKRSNIRITDLRLNLPGVSGWYDINSDQTL